MDSAEAGESGAAQDVGEDSFGLVIGGVGYGEPGQFFFFDESSEKGVARPASGILEVCLFAFGFGGNVLPADVKWKIVFGGEFGYEFFICFGALAAELVVEVDDVEDDAEFL